MLNESSNESIYTSNGHRRLSWSRVGDNWCSGVDVTGSGVYTSGAGVDAIGVDTTRAGGVASLEARSRSYTPIVSYTRSPVHLSPFTIRVNENDEQ